MKIVLHITMLFFATVLSAQSFVITNVTLFDGETVTENTSVLIEDGEITKISEEISTTATIIDGTGKFLMPAMTNGHVHAWSPQSLKEAAQAGVLNVLDMHGIETMQGMMKQLSDSTNYARYFVAGAAATVPGGHGTQYGFPTPTLTKTEEATKFVEDRLKAGANYLKIIVEPWKETLSHETVKALIDAAHEKQSVAVVHISKADDAKKVMANGADGLVHLWWDTLLTSSELNEWKKNSNAFIMPTLLTSKLFLENIRPTAPKESMLSDEDLLLQVKNVYEAGIPLLAGTDPPNAGINYGTDLYKELDLLSKAGIPNLEVLKTATSLPPKHFKLGTFGMIREGYKADLLLLGKNPILDIQNIASIETIWKEGKVVAQTK
ncbi:amidohydrolase family protein [Marinirhabdus gelatinilytica]|uniref:Imidazolonepropionase-like amidohydrolase n=1 Tax=Marinirhabdus gelatinilytica TaxID=1703343 RepID=A0A370QFJ9_9FLAO|nr:amidohydrolase family protein [Marinirhabdus gelatinilytica]RDK87143.1 imidazolonepropionase-like amidohydrolase [Marinirhabdus gelatinilytica]